MRKFRFTTIACVTVYRDYEITARDEADARRQAEAVVEGSLAVDPFNREEKDCGPPILFNGEVEEIGNDPNDAPDVPYGSPGRMLHSRVFEFTAAHGVPFRCRLVLQGESTGAGLRFRHDRDEPLVEFYDARYPFQYDYAGDKGEAVAAGARPLGQFVCSYCLPTLREGFRAGAGLALNGAIPAWRIDPDSLAAVHAWLDSQTCTNQADTDCRRAGDGADPGATVCCKFCNGQAPETTAHLHDGGWVGDDCCWDERLRSTE